VHVAVSLRHFAPRLILHSCAPSSLPFPDRYLQRLAGPLVFGPRAQRLTWRMVRALTSSGRGLRAVMASLSTVPTGEWWDRCTPADRAAARKTFAQMDSGSGFVPDMRQARAARSAYREAVLRPVPCPTLVTASRQDGGVAFRHAEDFVRTIPDSLLAETGAWSHLFWLGASRPAVWGWCATSWPGDIGCRAGCRVIRPPAGPEAMSSGHLYRLLVQDRQDRTRSPDGNHHRQHVHGA